MNPAWLLAFVGGIIIGGSASLMLLWNGRVTGISGILGGVVERFSAKSLTGDGSWRVFFLLGMISGGMILKIFYPQAFQGDLPTENRTLIAAGFLVGFGTLLGSGCTSGHGVCGISRLSVRSLCATILFILSGIISVLLFRHYGILPEILPGIVP